ncbi:MAG: hypothetical protein Fur0022_32600 [Anaerolineales bacterium]
MSTFFQRQAIEAFNQMRLQGFWNQIVNTLTGQPTTLPTLDEFALPYYAHRQSLGLQTISLQAIVGSLGRGQDFGPGFRPRRKSLQDRWTQIFMLAQEDRWEPVHLLKVGGVYFVEDGNHRVSVAHYLGRNYIDAEVWEHRVIPTLTLQGRCAHCGQLVAEQA